MPSFCARKGCGKWVFVCLSLLGIWTQRIVARRSTQVPSGMATVVGKSVFLSITMPVLELGMSDEGVDLPGKRMTLLGGGAFEAVAAP